MAGESINRLKGLRAYLAGPIDRVADGGKEWRERITPILNSMGVIVMDPLHKPYEGALENDDERKLRNKLKSEGNLAGCGQIMRTIRAMDLHMVDGSDFLIVKVDLDVHMCGTYEELFWANRMKKPILCFIKQGITHTPDWLLGTLPSEFFFNDDGEIVKYLQLVNSTDVIENFKRWHTPKFSMLYNEKVLGVLKS